MESARAGSPRNFAVVPAGTKRRTGTRDHGRVDAPVVMVPATGSPRRSRRGVPRAGTTESREKRRGLCTTTLLPLRRPDARRAGTALDRPGLLELLAVEVEHHDLFRDHALNQKRSVVLAPGEPLTPVPGLGLSQRDQFLAFDAQPLHQAIIVEERTILRLVRSVDHVHGG